MWSSTAGRPRREGMSPYKPEHSLPAWLSGKPARRFAPHVARTIGAFHRERFAFGQTGKAGVNHKSTGTRSGTWPSINRSKPPSWLLSLPVLPTGTGHWLSLLSRENCSQPNCSLSGRRCDLLLTGQLKKSFKVPEREGVKGLRGRKNA